MLIVHPGEEHAHGRIEGNCQDGGDGHSQVLAVSQRLEQAPFLVDEGENGQEGDRDDEKRKEDRGPDFLEGIQPDDVIITLPPPFLPELELLVGVFHFDDGPIDENADGDGDPGKRHDIGRQLHTIEGMNASRTEIGIVTIGMTAEGKCQRKRRMTILTMIISSMSWRLRVSIDRLISSERS